MTIKEAIYERLVEKALREHRSVTNMAEAIILEATRA